MIEEEEGEDDGFDHENESFQHLPDREKLKPYLYR